MRNSGRGIDAVPPTIIFRRGMRHSLRVITYRGSRRVSMRAFYGPVPLKLVEPPAVTLLLRLLRLLVAGLKV